MTDSDPQPNSPRLLRYALIAAWVVAVLLVAQKERARFANAPDDQPMWVTAVSTLDIDSSLFVPLLLVAPLIWWRALRGRKENSTQSGRPADKTSSWQGAVVLSLLAGALGWFASARVGGIEVREKTTFGSLPPAYHDEYAYLFQARTFAAGRTSFTAREPEGLFDQMHVLNDDGVFASRYFPATGAYLSPFVSAGRPYLGYRLANALICALFCLTGCRIAGLVAGGIAGMLVALAPGIAVFSNLLLAHHPTLLGLSLFVFAFFEAQRSRLTFWGLCAGFGLSFAMLARPMTAAGFALPFGLWVLFRLTKRDHRATFVRLSVGLGVPIVLGLVTLGAYNYSITGGALTSPYQLYTDIYTPNHVYGLDNVGRGNTVDAPKRIAKYDGWAENLTPGMAARNVQRRVVGSFQWTLGLVPNALLAVFALIAWPWLRFEARLVVASVISLHVAHIPYWFDGIMHYHYVFESSVMWCLLAGIVGVDLWRALKLKVVSLPSAWIVACLVVPLASAWVSLPNPFVAGADLFDAPRVEREARGIAFSRGRYAMFQEQLEKIAKPALVLVKHDPADIHIEYVNNLPSLDAEILIGHWSAFEEHPEVREQFADRVMYLFSARSGTLEELDAE